VTFHQKLLRTKLRIYLAWGSEYWVATGTGIKVKVSTATPTLVAVPNEVTMLPGRTVLTFPIAGRGKTGNAKVTVSVGDKAITKGITITQ